MIAAKIKVLSNLDPKQLCFLTVCKKRPAYFQAYISQFYMLLKLTEINNK